jgi:translation initiation factor 2B subunit (eIF-2B alpha/beta/delta family)
MKPAEDIYDERSPEHLSILNMYFDYTPLALFSYVISENGFLSIQRVREKMMNKQVQKRLMNVLSTLSL